MTVISWKNLLVISSIVILTGCQTLASPRTRLQTKPTLHAVTKPNGDVCFSKSDASELGAYILELERR